MQRMKKFANGHLRTWIEIDTRAVAHNYRTFRKLLGPKVKLMAVVKSNAYGHGLIDFSRVMVKLSVDWLGVDSIVEAAALRRAGIKTKIIVLGYTQPINFPLARKSNVTVAISSINSLRRLLATPHAPEFHLKLDTGMHRQGFTSDDFVTALALFSSIPITSPARTRLTGVFSHLAAASSSGLASSVAGQIKEFENFLEKLEQVGFPRVALIKHLSATGGTIGCSETRYDLVRVGLGLYGYWPSAEWRKHFGRKIKLQPALTWKTIISEVKTLANGGAVGYDLTECVKAGTKIAVCPVGYWHGYPRALSSRGRVFINNQSAKVIGRVSMDMIMIDVTKIKNARVGDQVILLGYSCPAEPLAQLAGTSNYEIVTRLNPLIKRFYL